jgi:hypothetical protein
MNTARIVRRVVVVIGLGLAGIGAVLGLIPTSVGSISCGSPWLPDTLSSNVADVLGRNFGMTGTLCSQTFGDRGSIAFVVALFGVLLLVAAIYIVPSRVRPADTAAQR